MKLTHGHVRYIMETMDQLLTDNHLTIANGVPAAARTSKAKTYFFHPLNSVRNAFNAVGLC